MNGSRDKLKKAMRFVGMMNTCLIGIKQYIKEHTTHRIGSLLMIRKIDVDGRIIHSKYETVWKLGRGS